jgi:hypothetical protein
VGDGQADAIAVGFDLDQATRGALGLELWECAPLFGGVQ